MMMDGVFCLYYMHMYNSRCIDDSMCMCVVVSSSPRVPAHDTPRNAAERLSSRCNNFSLLVAASPIVPRQDGKICSDSPLFNT